MTLGIDFRKYSYRNEHKYTGAQLTSTETIRCSSGGRGKVWNVFSLWFLFMCNTQVTTKSMTVLWWDSVMLCWDDMMTSSNGNIFRVTVLCAGNSPVTGEFPAQRPVTRSFDVFFDLRLINGWLNNQNVGDLRHHFAHYDATVMELKLHTYITIKSQDLNTRSWLTSSPTPRQMPNRECHPGGYYWNYSPGVLLYI